MRMRTALTLIFCGSLILIASGCADKRARVISPDIPLNIYDLEEIRTGVDNHKLLVRDGTFIEDEVINQYITNIGQKLAAVSERPYLPWRFFVTDSKEKLEAFAFPGGHIYISSGLLGFIESEAELAAVIAHEVGHTAAYRYQEARTPKKAQFMKMAKIGASAAGGFVGGAAGAAGSVLSGIESSSPYIKQQFSKSAEVEADGRAMNYLQQVGYPPEAVVRYNERLASIPIHLLPRFVHFFNAHPPSEFRVSEARKNLQAYALTPPSDAEDHWGAETYGAIMSRLDPAANEPEKKSIIDIMLDKAAGSASGDTQKGAPAEVVKV